jgi:outer membrane cobalamin receptor
MTIAAGVLRSATRTALLCAGLLCLFVSHRAPAQTAAISGRVTGTQGEALIGANVTVKGTQLGGATNLQGVYAIRGLRPGAWKLVVTMLGYEREERAVTLRGDDAAADFILREAAIPTDAVVVTAGRRGQSFEEIPVSIALLDEADIASRLISSLDDALRRIPGVNVTESTINVRGSSGYSRALGSRVLLLQDGVPVLSGDANEVKFDAVPLFGVERIEVVKGAGSALYGSSALGGVINVITRVPVENRTRARITSGFYDRPSYDQWKWWGGGPRLFHALDLRQEARAGGVGVMLSGGINTDQGYRQKDDHVLWYLSGKAVMDLSPTRTLAATAQFATNDRGNWVQWKDLAHALVPPDGSDLTERIRSNKLLGALRYRETISANFSHVATLSLFSTSFDTRSDTSDFSMRPNDHTQSTAHVIGAQWQGTLSLHERLTLVGGLDASETLVRSRTFGDHDGNDVAAYLQGDLHPTDAWTISLGLRVDATKTDTAASQQQVNPRLGVSWAPWHGTIVRASYGWGFRAGSIAEKFAVASAGGLMTRPNPALRPERSTSYEIGVKQELPLPAVIDGAIFLNDYDDLVEPRLDTSPEQAGHIYFDNLTRARILGAEIGVLTSLFDRHLDVSLAYTYVYPRDLTLGQSLKYRPRHLFYASGTAALWTLRLGVDFRYLSRVEAIDDALALVVRNADQRVETFVTDVRCSWDTAITGLPLTFTFMVNNLFRFNYAEIAGNLAPIRNFRLAMDVSF